jgi:DNA-binding CsgD family transcriptional regulator
MKSMATPRFISFKYDNEGIRVRGTWYPTLVMDWSSGIPLDQYLAEWVTSPQGDRAQLCNEWVKTVQDLRSRTIAHGDLQHENVLVKEDGTFQVIDYDGMFVPAMRDANLQATEVGRPAYQHPERSEPPYRSNYFDERLDDFSALVILLTLAAVDAPTWAAYHDDDRLIIGEQDLREPSRSPLLTELAQRKGPVARLTDLLVRAAEGSIEAVPSFETVIADPEVQAMLKGTTYQPVLNRPLPRGSRRPGLLPRSVGEPAASGRPVDVSRPPARITPGGEAPQKAGGTGPAELTRREAEVARLVAKGLSAPEIANQLSLAPTTITGHLRSLRRKSGSTSMESLTSWAITNFPPPADRSAGEVALPRPEKPHGERKGKTRPPRAASQVAKPKRARSSPEKAPAAPPSRRPPSPVLAGGLPDLFSLFDDPASPTTTPAGRLTAAGEAHLRAKRFRKALRAFDEALSKDPHYVPALVGRGEARRHLKLFDEALSDLNLALSLKPNDEQALRARSKTNRDAGRRVRSLADRFRAGWWSGRST